jgi:hypothetical protein
MVAEFERVRSTYAPGVVVVALNPGDDRRRAHDISETEVARPRGIERVLVSIWWLRARGRQRATAADANLIGRELERLREAVRASGGKLVVAVFEHHPSPSLTALEQVVADRPGTGDVPAVLSSSSLRAFAVSDLDVHPAVDRHPNDVAHRILASELAETIRRLRSPDTSAGARAPAAPNAARSGRRS